MIDEKKRLVTELSEVILKYTEGGASFEEIITALEWIKFIVLMKYNEELKALKVVKT